MKWYGEVESPVPDSGPLAAVCFYPRTLTFGSTSTRKKAKPSSDVLPTTRRCV